MDTNKLHYLVLLLLLSGCSNTPATEPLVALEPAKINNSAPVTYSSKFCTMGSKSDLGGMANMPDADQYAIGRCQHYKFDKSNLIIIYLGEDDSTKEFSEAELDAYLHPEEYQSEADAAEEACAPNSNCDKRKNFLARGALVYFDVDSVAPLSVAELQRIAQLVRDNPSKVEVVGHADSTYTEAHNMPLSVRRAKKVREILVSFGVPADLISITGKSSRDPVAPNESVDGRALNRRAQVIGVKNEH